MDNNLFEKLISPHVNAVERFVYYKISNVEDAKDIIQDVWLTSVRRINLLSDVSKIKAWLIRIAANKCVDYYRKKQDNITYLDDIDYSENKQKSVKIADKLIYEEKFEQDNIFDDVSGKDRTILKLYYADGMKIQEIAQELKIPAGTVKSRLFKARESFRQSYIKNNNLINIERNNNMSTKIKFPEFMPEFKITRTDETPIGVKCKELPNWFLLAENGGECQWASYDYPESPAKKLTSVTSMKVLGEAKVHGIDCLEIEVKDIFGEEHATLPSYDYGKITDTHKQYLAVTSFSDGKKSIRTFLEDDFYDSWGLGENENEGFPINLTSKAAVIFDSETNISVKNYNTPDIVGKYTVEINGKEYDTINLFNCDNKHGIAVESYIDNNGRTVLWRRYNRNDWCFDKIGQLWSEKLPESKQIKINGELYVHYYDCISDYIL